MQNIISAVEEQIAHLGKLFEKEPTRFFTEADLICCFHRLLTNALDSITADDREGRPHNLVHCEYPTPFRCDMAKKGFRLIKDECRTLKGGKFKRGHYDIVVFNPAFMKKHSYPELKAQNYENFSKLVQPSFCPDQPAIVYGVEFAFRRDALKFSRGDDCEKAVKEFKAEITQDSEKLAASVAHNGFMQHAISLAFVKGTAKAIREVLCQHTQHLERVTLFFAD